MIQVGVIWVGMILLKLNFRILAPVFFNFKNIIMPRVFERAVVSRVFPFNYFCTVPQRAPVGKISHPHGGGEKVESPLPSTLWFIASDVFRWIYPDAILTTPSYS